MADQSSFASNEASETESEIVRAIEGASDVITGSDNDEKLDGTASADTLSGGGGDDTLSGLSGDDSV